MTLAAATARSQEYAAIRSFYGSATARRSGVRLMNHIDEGLRVLEEIGADYLTARAFCLHPLFQADDDLLKYGMFFAAGAANPPPPLMVLVMEYRSAANRWLSDKVTVSDNGRIIFDGRPHPGPLRWVQEMLIADKVQNYKDFLTYHKATHPRSGALDAYFNAWLQCLNVNPVRFQELCKAIDRNKEKT